MPIRLAGLTSLGTASGLAPVLIVRTLSLRDFRSYARSSSSSRPGSCSSWARTAPARRTCSRRCTSARRASRRGRATTRSWSASARRRHGSRSRASAPATTLEIERHAAGPAREAGAAERRALRAAEQLRAEVATLVFTPDRLAVVKGGPAARRAYFDRASGRLFPARAPVPAEYAAAVAQRNAALRRVAHRRLLARGARAVDGARRRAGPSTRRRAGGGARGCWPQPFAERAAALGLPGGALDYEARAADRRGARGAARARPRRGARPASGPHLDDVGDRGGRPRPAQLRLAGRAAPGRARAAAGGGGAPRRARPPPRRSCCSTTCSPSSTSGARGALAERMSRSRPDARHGDGGLGAAGRAGAARRGRSRERAMSARADRRRGAARARRGSARPRGWRRSSRAWPEAVGEHDRRATPGRRGSPATARCTSRRRRRPGRSSSRSSSRRFWSGSRRRSARPRPGALALRARAASRARRSGGRPTSRRSPSDEPTQRTAMQQPSSPRGIDDESLREIVAKAAAASLARGR